MTTPSLPPVSSPTPTLAPRSRLKGRSLGGRLARVGCRALLLGGLLLGPPSVWADSPPSPAELDAEPVSADEGPTPGAEGEATTTPTDTEQPSRQPVEIVRAQIAGPPGHRDVRSIRRLLPGGGRVDWSRQGDWVAFDKTNDRGLRALYIHDVENGSERCLSCDLYELRRSHVLDPVWHPSGEHLVVQVQDSARRLKMGSADLATPHRGIHSELWIIHRDGRSAWQLTRGQERGAAVLDPHFSYEGNRLVWSERLSSVQRPWGDWGLRVGEIKIKRGVPRLNDIRLFEPEGMRPGFVVATEFTPNDRGLLLAASPDPGQRPSGRDLLRYDLESGALERLTRTPRVWDDRPTISPKGDHLVWVSDRNIPDPLDPKLPYRGDLWLRVEREGREERLTYFNDPKSDHALGTALIDDIAWSPRGDLLAIHVVSLPDDAIRDENDEYPYIDAIYLVTLDASYQR